MFRTLSVLVLALDLFQTGARADAADKYRISCKANELAALNAAVTKANELAKSAAAALPPVDSNGGARFTRWFGGPEGDYDPVVRDIYLEMRVNLIFQRFWCLPPNSTTPDWMANTDAFIRRGTVGEIFVTSNFFHLPTSSAMSQAGTIVHEASHQSAKRKVVDDDIDGDGHNDYGPTAAEKRAGLSSTRARATADNFKYFAEDVVFGVP